MCRIEFRSDTYRLPKMDFTDDKLGDGSYKLAHQFGVITCAKLCLASL